MERIHIDSWNHANLPLERINESLLDASGSRFARWSSLGDAREAAGLEPVAADAILEISRCRVRHWVWLLLGAGACTSGAGPEAASGGAGASESTTCPPGRLSGACSVRADVRCSSGHWDCLCPGRIPFASPASYTCVNGAWVGEPASSCSCGDDGGEADGGGSAGSDPQ
jgi:hypothetical protein